MKTPSWDRESFTRTVFDVKQMCAAARRSECRAYQWADGFDDYNNAGNAYEYVQGSPSYGTAYRRFAPPAGLPGQGVLLGTSTLIRKNLAANQATIICKLAVCPQSAPSTSSLILGVCDNGTSQVALCWNNAGALQAYSGWEHSGGNILLGSTASGILAAGVYYGIEVEFVIGAPGSITVWVNGTQVMLITGVNTNFDGNSYGNQVQISDGGVAYYIDDFRVWDGTGSYQNAPLGTDSRIITKLPSGAGALTQFTPNGAAANWQCVDDNPPDGDTTYVSASAAGTSDAYAVPSAGLTQNPAMVVARAYARKDDSNTRTLAVGAYDLAYSIGSLGANVTVGSSYAFVDGCIPLDPHTGAPWLLAAADAAQIYMQETT